jgi:UDP-2,3-diacylglucosamine pyrophosphatase LpxH
MKSWTLEQEAVIIQSVKEYPNMWEAFDKSALLLNRTTAAVRNRYYNYLRRARMTRKSKEKCIVIDKDTVSEYRKEYKQQEDVTIIILHIRGKR